MARSGNYKGNNEGGYGNPPVSGQFTGEPGPGRPKGSKSMPGALRKTFNKKIPRIDKKGNRTFVDAQVALAERALLLGLTGSLPANIEARKLAEQFGPQEGQVQKKQSSADLTKLSDMDLQLYGYLARKIVGNSADEEDFDPVITRVLDRIAAVISEEEEFAASEKFRDGNGVKW